MCIILEMHLPILYNGVLRPGIKTSIFSGLTVESHYRQVGTWLHTVPQIHVIIERHVQWVVLLSVRRGKWWTVVEVHFKGEVTVSRYKEITANDFKGTSNGKISLRISIQWKLKIGEIKKKKLFRVRKNWVPCRANSPLWSKKESCVVVEQ